MEESLSTSPPFKIKKKIRIKEKKLIVMKIIKHVVLYNIINAEKKSMLTKWSHCDDQVMVQSIRHQPVTFHRPWRPGTDYDLR